MANRPAIVPRPSSAAKFFRMKARIFSSRAMLRRRAATRSRSGCSLKPQARMRWVTRVSSLLLIISSYHGRRPAASARMSATRRPTALRASGDSSGALAKVAP